MARSHFVIGENKGHTLDVAYSNLTCTARIRVDGNEVARKRLFFVPHTFKLDVGDEPSCRVELRMNPWLCGQGKVWVNGECLGRLLPSRVVAAVASLYLVLCLLALPLSFCLASAAFKMPLLCSTSLFGWVQPTRVLLRMGLNPNVQSWDRFGDTPLHFAMLEGDAKIGQILLKAGADPNARDKTDATPLHDAAYAGSVECMRLLLSNGADLTAVDEQGETPLRNAIHGDNPKNAVSLLLAAGAKVDDLSSSGTTALYCAAKLGNEDVVAMLLRAGANVNPPPAKENASPLASACMNGHLGVVKMLLTAGADVNAVFKANGATPLHLACMSGDPEVVRLLLQSKANINAVDATGKTPLSTALKKDNRIIVRLLRNAGGHE